MEGEPGSPGVYVRDGTAIAIGTRSVARIAGALANPIRVRILEACIGEARSLSELAGILGVSEATVSGHVRVLEKYGLVKARYRPSRSGRGLEKLVEASVERVVLRVR